jgi:predicted DNA-binding protein
MTDDLKERLRANHLDECYDAIDRIEQLEAKLALAVEVLERISEHDHQRTAADAIRYFLPTNNTGAVQEALISVASTDMQAWARTTIAELRKD